MTSLFCRHNRMTAQLPDLLEGAGGRAAREGAAAARRASAARRPRRAPRRARRAARSGRLVTRRLARAEDDGYRNPLVPGLRATADAERLAARAR